MNFHIKFKFFDKERINYESPKTENGNMDLKNEF